MYDAVPTFNIGNIVVICTYEKLGIVAGNNMRKGCFADAVTLRKTTSLPLGLKLQKKDKIKVVEGKTYSSGAF